MVRDRRQPRLDVGSGALDLFRGREVGHADSQGYVSEGVRISSFYRARRSDRGAAMRLARFRSGQVTIGIAVAFALLTATVPMAGAQPDIAGVGTPGPRESLRAQLGPLQAHLRKEHDQAYGGPWIDENGRPVVAIIGEGVEIRNAIAASNAAISPSLVPVDSSETDREALHSAIVSATSDGVRLGTVEFAAVETDIMNNRVNVPAIGANRPVRRVQQLGRRGCA